MAVQQATQLVGDRFVEVLYEVYAPRVLAGISGLKDTLEDRASRW